MKCSSKLVYFAFAVLVLFATIFAFSGGSEVGNTEDLEVYMGRFKAPGVGIDVGCYSSSSQATVDARDSAAYFYWCGRTVIADHDYQGFGAIKRCQKGMTAYMVSSSGTVSYTCVDVIRGHKSDWELMDTDCNSIADLYPGALICYICNLIPGSITIAFFAPN